MTTPTTPIADALLRELPSAANVQSRPLVAQAVRNWIGHPAHAQPMSNAELVLESVHFYRVAIQEPGHSIDTLTRCGDALTRGLRTLQRIYNPVLA